MQLLLPGYNYCGPGNPVPNGTPTSKLDKLCEEHDVSYEEYDSFWRYLRYNQADEKFLQQISALELEPRRCKELAEALTFTRLAIGRYPDVDEAGHDDIPCQRVNLHQSIATQLYLCQPAKAR